MPTTPSTKTSTPTKKLSIAYWMVKLKDDYGNEYTGFGETHDEVWEQVAEVSNFDVPSTKCTLYEKFVRCSLKDDQSTEIYWKEREVYYGDSDECLIAQLTRDNFYPSDVL